MNYSTLKFRIRKNKSGTGHFYYSIEYKLDKYLWAEIAQVNRNSQDLAYIVKKSLEDNLHTFLLDFDK